MRGNMVEGIADVSLLNRWLVEPVKEPLKYYHGYNVEIPQIGLSEEI